MAERTTLDLKEVSETIGCSKQQLVDQLIRLDAVTPGRSVTTPVERLNIALETVGSSENRVARKYGIHHEVVHCAKRDTTAAYAFLMGTEVKDEEVLARLRHLQRIAGESDRLSIVMKEPEIKKRLNKISGVKELLAGYLRWGTVKPLLEELKVPFNKYQLRSVGHFFKATTVEDSLDGLTQLARRYAFAKWLNTDDGRLDAKISEAAVYILGNDFSDITGQQLARLGPMKQFLVKSMDREYLSIGGNIDGSLDDFALFPKGYSGSKNEVSEAYQRLSKGGYCPISLKNYAMQVVSEVALPERVKRLGFGEYYSANWQENVDWAGLKFLETTIAWQEDNFSSEMFMINTGDILKEVKNIMLIRESENHI